MSAWIKVSQSLLCHHKTLEVAEELDIDEVAVVGHLIALWTWAIDNAPDGELPASDRRIAIASMWCGSPSHWVSVLSKARFIDDDYDGHRRLHNWEEWTGALMRRRKESAERMRKMREKKKTAGSGNSVF